MGIIKTPSGFNIGHSSKGFNLSKSITGFNVVSNNQGLPLAIADRVTMIGFPSTSIDGEVLTPFTVEAQNPTGGVIETYEGDVTMSILTGTGTLGGTLTKPLINGVATFDDIVINGADTFSIQAACADLTPDAGIIIISSALIDYGWVNIQGLVTLNETLAISSVVWGQAYSNNLTWSDLMNQYIGYITTKGSKRHSIGLSNSTSYAANRTHLNRAALEYANSVYAKDGTINRYVTAAYTAGDIANIRHSGTNWQLFINDTLKYTWNNGSAYTYIRFFNELPQTLYFSKELI